MCSRHFRLSGSASLYFMSSTVMADVFLPLLNLSGCVNPFHELHHDHGWHVPVISIIRKFVFISHEQQNHSWHVPATFNSQAVRNYSHFICDNIQGWLVPTPFPIIRKCVFIFHGQHNHSWHVSVTFDSQLVRIPIPWAGPFWLTCSCHFRLSGSEYLY